MTLLIEDADEFGCTAYTAVARLESAPDGIQWLIYDLQPDPPPDRYEAVWDQLRAEIDRQLRNEDRGD